MKKQTKQNEKNTLAGELFFWAQALTVALAVLVCVNTFFFRLSGVVGQSMENTLHQGDQLILQVIGYDQPGNFQTAHLLDSLGDGGCVDDFQLGNFISSQLTFFNHGSFLALVEQVLTDAGTENIQNQQRHSGNQHINNGITQL